MDETSPDAMLDKMLVVGSPARIENMYQAQMNSHNSKRAEMNQLKDMLVLRNSEITTKVQNVDERVDEGNSKLERGQRTRKRRRSSATSKT